MSWIQNCVVAVCLWLSVGAAGAAEMAFIKTPYPGSQVFKQNNKAYVNDFYLLLSKPVAKDGEAIVEKTQKLEGALQQLVYEHRKEDSEVQIFESYKQALQTEGYSLEFVCPTGCTGELSWFELIKKYQGGETTILPIRNYGYLAARKGNVSVAVLTGGGAEGEAPISVVSVLTAKALDNSGIEVNKDFISAADIGKKLQQDGKVALYGIYFDTGNATLKPGSVRVLNEVAQYLKANTRSKLYVVGHTDDAGDYNANLALSDQRAAAVVADLLTRSGVKAERLLAKGVGPLAPVASNKNDAGKQLNRRVELIERLD